MRLVTLSDSSGFQVHVVLDGFEVAHSNAHFLVADELKKYGSHLTTLLFKSSVSFGHDFWS